MTPCDHRKTVLVLGGGTYHLRVLAQLRDAGYRVVVVDGNPQAPGLAAADRGFALNLADAEAVLRVARDERVDGVMALNDSGVRSAAHVATALGLAGITPEAAELANDKGRMRERWAADGLPNPDFRVVTTMAEAEVAFEALGAPVVVKPADSGGGGRGVSVVRRAAELDWAFRFAVPSARNGRVVVERFIEGVELTVECLTYRGETTVLTMSDKVKPELRTRVATSLRYPAALSAAARSEVEDVTRRAVASLGITEGATHLELIVRGDGRPVLVELGARGGGGHVFSTVVEAVTGVSMVLQLARILTGEEPALEVERERGCVYRLFAPAGGVIRAIRGVEEARRKPGVLDLGVTRSPGDVLGELTDSLQRSGFAVVCGADREEAIRRAEAVAETVVFELDPIAEEAA